MYSEPFNVKKVEHDGKELKANKLGDFVINGDKFDYGKQKTQVAVYTKEKEPFVFDIHVKKQDQIVVKSIQYQAQDGEKPLTNAINLKFPDKMHEKLSL